MEESHSLPNKLQKPTYCRFKYVPVIFDKLRELFHGINIQLVAIPPLYLVSFLNSNLNSRPKHELTAFYEISIILESN